MKPLASLFAAAILLFMALPVSAAEPPVGELLLTVAPPGAEERMPYLDDIAAQAGATVVKVYAALSLGPDDPMLLFIRSDTNDTEEMLRLL